VRIPEGAGRLGFKDFRRGPANFAAEGGIAMIGTTRARAVAIGLAVLIAVPIAAWAQSDEFVRQDRWATVTWQFQDGYAMGVWDTVQDLADFPVDVRAYVPLLIRKAHTCLHTMTESTEVAAFAARSIARIAACAVVGAPSNSTVDAVGGTFMWKGRWDTDRAYFAREDLHEGYATGVADILRHLDNTGKTPAVLVRDIVDAGQCSIIKTVDDLANLVGPAIDAHKDDPSASTSGVIFDAFLACGRTK
jgi:hypothetical protein